MTQIEMIETIASLGNEAQNKFYDNLIAQGFPEKDIFVIQNMVFYYKMFTEKSFYDAVQISMRETIYNELK